MATAPHSCSNYRCRQRQRPWQMQDRRRIGQRINGQQRVQHVGAGARTDGGQYSSQVMSRDFPEWRRGSGASRSQVHKGRSLIDSAAQPHTKGDEHGANHKGDSPTPFLEAGCSEHQRYNGHGAHAQYGSAGGAQLGVRSVAPALLCAAVFQRQQDGTGPFAAKRRALDKAQRDQQGRAPDAPMAIRGQHADQTCRDAHQHQRCE